MRYDRELLPDEHSDRWHHTSIINGRPEIRGFESNEWYTEIYDSARVNEFVTIQGSTDITHPTIVMENTMLMAHSHVGHNVAIGCYSEISSGTVLGGYSTIKAYVRVGINSTILPYRHIQLGSRIGSGSVVTKHVGPFEVWCGNPATFLRYVTDDEAKEFYSPEIYKTYQYTMHNK